MLAVKKLAVFWWFICTADFVRWMKFASSRSCMVCCFLKIALKLMGRVSATVAVRERLVMQLHLAFTRRKIWARLAMQEWF